MWLNLGQLQHCAASEVASAVVKRDIEALEEARNDLSELQSMTMNMEKGRGMRMLSQTLCRMMRGEKAYRLKIWQQGCAMDQNKQVFYTIS